MPDISSRIHVGAPPEAVFDFVDHWPNAKRYLRRMVRWEPVDPQAAIGVGAVFHVAVQAGPTRLDGKLEVTQHLRPSTIAFRSQEGPRVEGSWSFEGQGEGTSVVLSASYDLPGGIAGRIVNAFLRRHAQSDLDASLRALKRLVEPGA